MTTPTTETLDRILTIQLSVAAAGERPEESRRTLGWWDCDLLDELGGGDYLKRLLPETWRWAGLQAVREIARRTDEQGRIKVAEPDRLRSLFLLGFELDEALELRLLDHKREGRQPSEALAGLLVPGEEFAAGELEAWLAEHALGDRPKIKEEPSGRRVIEAGGELSTDDPLRLVQALAAALAPLPADADNRAWPFPHVLVSAEGLAVRR